VSASQYCELTVLLLLGTQMLNIQNSQEIAIYGAVGENWYHGSQVHINNIEACHSCTGARSVIRTARCPGLCFTSLGAGVPACAFA
jgi:hypothetical protein